MFNFLKKLFSRKRKRKQIISVFSNQQEAVVHMGGSYGTDIC